MGLDASNDSAQTAEIDVDKILAEVDAPAPERAMSGPVEAAPPEAKAPVAQTPTEHEFMWSGKKIKAPLDKILTKFAPMGYDYAQRMESFKSEKEQYRKELEDKYKPLERYKSIDEYVKKDPAWWKHVEEQWNQRTASNDPAVQRAMAIVEEKLKPYEEIIQRDQAQQQEFKIKTEDDDLAKDIGSIRKKYSNIDFDTPDADGKSLEMRVLQHGSKHGFHSYTAAFRDFYHDQLEKMAEARGKESLNKDAQKRAKLGLSATPQTPTKKSGDYSVKGKSYNEIEREVLAELGIA